MPWSQAWISASLLQIIGYLHQGHVHSLQGVYTEWGNSRQYFIWMISDTEWILGVFTWWGCWHRLYNELYKLNSIQFKIAVILEYDLGLFCVELACKHLHISWLYVYKNVPLISGSIFLHPIDWLNVDLSAPVDVLNTKYCVMLREAVKCFACITKGLFWYKDHCYCYRDSSCNSCLVFNGNHSKAISVCQNRHHTSKISVTLFLETLNYIGSIQF